MKRFVVVEACPFPDVLRARCAQFSYSVRLTPVRRPHRTSVIDEHLAVNVDACADASLLECGDVLQGSRAYSVAAALRRVVDLIAAHPACGVAAVPLGGGLSGWALAGGSDRCAILVPSRAGRPGCASEEQSLLPSCLHAWLVAGRSLREWPDAHVVPTG
ncbi:hypothetical protein OG338_13790 [Streptomyces sp. NBC_00726]|uniref:hypothetical protein n=1 Tax=Streptomyces sp. NBC_00726 TaxID=2903674 RepID=UPI00386ECBA7